MDLKAAARHEVQHFVGMVPPRLTKYAGWLLEWPYSALTGPAGQKSVFVISPPRSGSTLLYNLLAWNSIEHREIVGYGENSAGYHSPRDIRRLHLRTMIYLRRRSLPEYVADKLVQSRYKVAAELLGDENCYFIFLERNRADTLRSFERKLNLDPQSAQELLATRQADLRAKRSQARNQLTVDYETLIDDPHAVLAEISRFLGLTRSLTDQYEVPPNIGNFAFGDDGQNIRAGRVVPGTRTSARRERPD